VKCSLPNHENERQQSVNACWLAIMVDYSAMWLLLSIYMVLAILVYKKAHEYLVVALQMK
jgi:hypothetical protein